MAIKGEAADPSRIEQIQKLFVSVPSVNKLIHMRTMHFGADELLIAAKLEFARDLSTFELAREINKVENAVRGALPLETVIYIEPDIRNQSSSPET